MGSLTGDFLHGEAGSAAASSKPARLRDPNAPKKPLSPYIHFSMMERSNLTPKDGKVASQDISRELGRMWNSLSDAAKKPYEAIAQVDKDRYEREFAEY
ncbi:high mobility group box domain-containing protein, partial [Dimargaris cristalligena]